MEYTSQEMQKISYLDTGYTFEELERIFDKKAHQCLQKRKSLRDIDLYLLTIAAIKHIKLSQKNGIAGMQEIINALEQLEQKWFLYKPYYQKRYVRLVHYQVLKLCDKQLSAL